MVAKVVWNSVVDFLGIAIGSDYFSVASKWLQKEKYYCVNVISSAVMRGIWLKRNDFIFNKQVWVDVKVVMRRIQRLLVEWRPIFKEGKMDVMMSWLSSLERLIR
jgi:hypothetical protein